VWDTSSAQGEPYILVNITSHALYAGASILHSRKAENPGVFNSEKGIMFNTSWSGLTYVGSEHIQSPSLGVTFGLLRPKLSPPGGNSSGPRKLGLKPLPNGGNPRPTPGGPEAGIGRSGYLPRPLPPL
jgi:hypothetical protein